MHQVSPDGPGFFALQIFMLFLVHAYSTRVWKEQEADNSKLNAATIEHGFQSPEGHRKLVMDGPWTLLWPCVLLWPFLQAALAYGWMHNALSMSQTVLQPVEELYTLCIIAPSIRCAALAFSAGRHRSWLDAQCPKHFKLRCSHCKCCEGCASGSPCHHCGTVQSLITD